MLGLLGGGNPVPIKIASAAKQCLEFITQRTKRATIQGHQAESPTTTALKKTRKKKCSSKSLSMWLETLGRLPCGAGQSVGTEFTSFSLLSEAKEAQTEEYQLRSLIKLIINVRSSWGEQQMNNHNSYLFYACMWLVSITLTGLYDFDSLKQFCNILIGYQIHGQCKVSHLAGRLLNKTLKQKQRTEFSLTSKPILMTHERRQWAKSR